MKQELDAFYRITGGLAGVIVGDALGVPAEFVSRSKLKKHPIINMIGGGIWNQPPGTWSDDSSMTLCLVHSLIEKGYDPDDLGQKFIGWWKDGYCTAHGKFFDIGNTTRDALTRIQRGIPALQAGSKDEHSNGNGSLMRILPAALYYAQSPQEEMIKAISGISSITHAHPRSQLACCLYALMTQKLLAGKEPYFAYQELCDEAEAVFSSSPFQSELKTFSRLLNGCLLDLHEEEIRSEGYVVYCLESAIWCLLKYCDFSSTVLAAVNLGDDTDTNGAVAGGLAGICYGKEAIPVEWLAAVVGWNNLSPLFDEFARLVLNK